MTDQNERKIDGETEQRGKCCKNCIIQHNYAKMVIFFITTNS